MILAERENQTEDLCNNSRYSLNIRWSGVTESERKLKVLLANVIDESKKNKT